MAIDHLFDTTVRVWRRGTTLGPQRNEIVTYSEVGSTPVAANAVVNRPAARATKTGPGVAPIGERTVYMAEEADVQLRDVLEFTAGPDAGYRGEVNDVPTRPRGHHLEIATQVWHGKLPGD